MPQLFIPAFFTDKKQTWKADEFVFIILLPKQTKAIL
jgi:hypothetical protein